MTYSFISLQSRRKVSKRLKKVKMLNLKSSKEIAARKRLTFLHYNNLTLKGLSHLRGKPFLIQKRRRADGQIVRMDERSSNGMGRSIFSLGCKKPKYVGKWKPEKNCAFHEKTCACRRQDIRYRMRKRIRYIQIA